MNNRVAILCHGQIGIGTGVQKEGRSGMGKDAEQTQETSMVRGISVAEYEMQTTWNLILSTLKVLDKNQC